MVNIQTTPAERKQSPWGFWATIGLSLVVFLVFVAVSVLVVVGVAAANAGTDGEESLATIATSGFVAFLGIVLAAPLCVGLVLLFIKLKATLPAKEYLGLVPVRPGTALIWFAFLGLMLGGSDLLTYMLNRPIAPEVMVDLYRTSGFVALSWFAIIVAGPIFEEVLFRGFMFRGIQASALGNGGAILITAASWAIIHAQYDAYLIATIFVLGVLFGAARAKTGSLYLPLAMHMAVNLVATIEMHLFAGS